ncbi:RHS repeat-associated core domain-containing protein [Treponema denticola ATCC 33520]|nr:RHS repeat-associated core domain-containing protein [Treponema denticola ATCC 33520]
MRNDELVWSADYDIYGRLRNVKGERTFIPFRQVGQIEDSELEGLYYNRYRWYNSETGCYISQDPIGLKGGNPTLYGYVENPNAWIDVFGLSATCQAEIQDLPQFAGMTRDEIHRELERRGFTKIKDRNGDQTFVKQTDDGMYAVVRTDSGKNSGGGYADDVDHSHKETTGSYNENGFTDTRSTTTYNDLGNTSSNREEIHIPMR